MEEEAKDKPLVDEEKRKVLLDQVFQKHFQELTWFAGKKTGHLQDVDDIVMEAMSRFMKYQPALREETEEAVL